MLSSLRAPVPWPEVLVDGTRVPSLRCRAKVEHWPREPAVGGFAEAQPRVGGHRVPSSSACEQFIAELASSHDPAVDRQRPLDTDGVLETDLEDPGGPPVDIPLHPHAPGFVHGTAHETALS